MSSDVVIYSSSTLEERKSYASTLAKGGDLIPKGLWAPWRDSEGVMQPAAPSAGKVLLVMETGAMLGLHPVAALQGVHIIEGKATLSPALMSAVVRKAGHQLRVKTEGTIKDGTFAATATLTRSDDPDFTYSASWTMERAERAGLATKDVWKKYGEAMCKARAISEVCREGAEDALMGVHYTPEELDAVVDEDGTSNVVDATIEPSEDWPRLIAEANTKEDLLALAKRIDGLGEYTDALRTSVLTKVGTIAREPVTFADESAPDGDPAAETDEQYTDRLIAEGAALGKNRQCSIGYHDECSDREDETHTHLGVCKCECHLDPAAPSEVEMAAIRAENDAASQADES